MIKCISTYRGRVSPSKSNLAAMAAFYKRECEIGLPTRWYPRRSVGLKSGTRIHTSHNLGNLITIENYKCHSGGLFRFTFVLAMEKIKNEKTACRGEEEPKQEMQFLS